MPDTEAATGGYLPSATRPGAVTLRVADLGVEARFYQDVLGLELRSESSTEIALGAGDRTLVRLRTGARSPARATAPGLYHLALLLPDRSSLGAWLRHALERGTPLQGAADHGVSEAVYLADPEGNGVEVYRDRPRRTWAVEHGFIRMVTEPLDAAEVVAAATGTWERAPDATVMGHVHLQVAELARARAFYGRDLGLPVTNDRFPGACFLGAGGYHHHLGLNSWGLRPDAIRDADGPGLLGFELHLPSAADVSATASRLQARGRTARHEDRVLVVRDPDGIDVRLLAGPDAGP